ncbi:MAG: hypothetical protein H0V23_03755, partial [Nocardioidaceae bacterium]|nr:hypothetical protein [Nocardioidaceae bacterium]
MVTARPVVTRSPSELDGWVAGWALAGPPVARTSATIARTPTTAVAARGAPTTALRRRCPRRHGNGGPAVDLGSAGARAVSLRGRVAAVEYLVVPEDLLLSPTPVVDDLGRLFAASGEEIALVGGPVRDALLARLGTDWDFATSASPDVTERLVRGWAD